jgi:hypothetical protein
VDDLKPKRRLLHFGLIELMLWTFAWLAYLFTMKAVGDDFPGVVLFSILFLVPLGIRLGVGVQRGLPVWAAFLLFVVPLVGSCGLLYLMVTFLGWLARTFIPVIKGG